MASKKKVDPRAFIALAKKGLNIRQIALALEISPNVLSKKMNKILGIYPAIYIARMRRGQTERV